MAYRISSRGVKGGTVVRIEGRLDAPAIPDLLEASRAVGHPLRLDLSGLRSADAGGAEELRRLAEAGAELTDMSPYIRQLVLPTPPLRDRIVTAAEAICLRDGVARMSMRKVAEEVGVSAAAIYRHFENKQALVNEIVVVGLRSLETYLRPALEEETASMRLRRLCERFLDFALEQPEHFGLAFLNPDTDRDHIEEEVGRPMWGTFRLAIEQISQCMEQGVLQRDDPLSTAILIWGHAYGLITLYRTGGLGDDVEAFRRLCGDSLDRLLTGLRPPHAVRDMGRSTSTDGTR